MSRQIAIFPIVRLFIFLIKRLCSLILDLHLNILYLLHIKYRLYRVKDMRQINSIQITMDIVRLTFVDFAQYCLNSLKSDSFYFHFVYIFGLALCC